MMLTLKYCKRYTRFSGADLANLVNEVALFAARANKKIVDMDDFEKLKTKFKAENVNQWL